MEVETISSLTHALLDEGVTGYGPTIISESRSQILNALRVIASACERDPLTAGCVVGIHVEGPSISSEDGPRGAHRS